MLQPNNLILWISLSLTFPFHNIVTNILYYISMEVKCWHFVFAYYTFATVCCFVPLGIQRG